MRLRRGDKDTSDKREQREKTRRRRSANRRARGAIAAVVLAVVGAAGLVAFVKGAEDRALAGEKLVDVLVVGDSVAAGTRATELEGKVSLEQVPAKSRAEGAVSELDSLSGLVASVELLPGEQVTSARFVPADAYTGRSTQVSVPEDKHEVTVSLAPERAVGGVVRPGSTVGVLASFDPFDQRGGSLEEDSRAVERTPNSTHLILHKVLVTNVQSSRAFEPGGIGDGDDASGTAQAPQEDLLVTLALDGPSVERVVFAAEHGSLWLSLEPEAAPEQGTRVQTRESIYE